jgi:hypothetical protein
MTVVKTRALDAQIGLRRVTQKNACFEPSSLISIMIAALGDFNVLSFAFAAHPINQAVLTSDAPRPPFREGILKGLRLAEPLEWVAPDILDEFIDGIEDLRVLFLPLKIFFPG